jgi:hypothetical protein
MGPKSSGRIAASSVTAHGLAIAYDRGLALRFRMQRDHPFQECGLCVGDVLNGLPRDGIGQESNEVAGVPRLEGDPDLAIRLEAADARTMARARIDNDERALAWVDFHAVRRQHADKAIVHRLRQSAAVHDELMPELEDVGRGLGGMLLVARTALPQDVPEQDAPLAGVSPISPRVPPLIDSPFRDRLTGRSWT